MGRASKIDRKARKMCRHTVCFTDPQSRLIAARAMQGISTKAIADELGISLGQAQYAITKAQHSLGDDVRLRRDYRNGNGKFVRKMMQATQKMALKMVSNEITPHFARLAAEGVPRLA